MNYVEVNIDKGILVKADTVYRSSKWAIRDKRDDTIYPFEVYDVLEDGDYLVIDNSRIPKENCEVVSMEEASDYLAKLTERDVYRDAREKIESPYEHKYGPFTEAVLVAVLKDGENDFARSKKQHNDILSVIRDINKKADKEEDENEASFKKLRELLKFFNMKPEDVLKEKYVLKKETLL